MPASRNEFSAPAISARSARMRTPLFALRLPLLLLGMLALTLVGCYHKDVMTDTADDVISTLLYQGPEGNLIISKESVFQANNKESGGGMTTISGFTEMRLSCYRIATGELAGRVELGDMIDEANSLLGYSPGKIWMFSIDPELGLHYRDPLTLEVKESWPQLSQKPGLAAFKPARPDWPVIDQYFVFDWNADRLLLTDEAGYKYALDPNSLQIQRVEAEMPRVDWDGDIQSGSGEFNVDQSISLEGDPRKVISFAGKKTHDDVSFLEGAWIIDHDPHAAGQRKQKWDASLRLHAKELEDSLVAFSNHHVEANQEPDWSKWNYDQRNLHALAEQLRRDIADAQREITNWSRPYKELLNYPLLTSDQRSAYILHANMVSDTAHSIVSRVNLAPDSTWSIVWTTHLQGIFHDHNKADQAGAFEIVYSKGNPEFDYEWAATDGNYLVLILQLHMLALDLKTGKLVWNIEI